MCIRDRSETIEDEQTVYAAWMYRKQTVHDLSLIHISEPTRRS